LKFKIKIENANVCNIFEDYELNPDDNQDQENQTTIEQTWSINHDFSVVDNCWQNSNKTYRYYKVRVVSIDNN